MANNLNRDIEANEIVILAKETVKPEFWADRRFQCKGGFGMKSYTGGSAVYGTWLVDGEESRQEGDDIDAVETEEWQAIHGKFGEKDTPATEEGAV